ncbi:pickpocket protein 28 isoform X2 [Aethina tumida]|uniref:pickpocket protein 28 isoform X2 n=1 Tax=Aethina tumida TaxID=116153 RepID=UPI002147EAE7|nr:pickpocket protein 28 isoform X2 [Aethina tumida]
MSVDQIPKKCEHSKRVKHYFFDYCDNTSIHAMKYFAQKRTTTEKFYWIVVITSAMMVLGYFIYVLAIKYLTMPVIVTFSTKETPVFEVPFPTITICSKAKIDGEHFNYTDIMLKTRTNVTLTKKEQDLSNYAAWICEDEIGKKSFRDKYYKTQISEDIYEFLSKSRRTFMHYCYLMGSDMKCQDYFTPILTDEGVCYSFNFLNHSQVFRDDVVLRKDFFQNNWNSTWHIEKGYKDAIGNDYPIRAFLTGPSKSLSIIMYAKKSSKDQLCSSDDSGGYLVSIDIPGKFPRMAETVMTIGSNINVLGAIQPEVFTTSEAIKGYSPEQRDCYFQDEKYLRFFKIYTQSNCQLECFTNYTLQFCNCSAFYMPMLNGTPVCGISMYECMEDAEFDSLFVEIFSKKSSVPERFQHSCDCMPLCYDINYNLEISQNHWKDNKISRIKGKDYNKSLTFSERFFIPPFYLEEDEEVEFASLTLFMKRNHLETKQRNEVYGFIDFLSGFGGLLGLFTGFSLLSLMEIVYFLSVRVFGNYRQHGNWHGENVEQNPA